MITNTSIGGNPNGSSIHINFDVNNVSYLIAVFNINNGQIQIIGCIPSSLPEDPSSFTINEAGCIGINTIINRPLEHYDSIYDYIFTHDDLPSVVRNFVDNLSNLEELCDAGFRAVTLIKNANF